MSFQPNDKEPQVEAARVLREATFTPPKRVSSQAYVQSMEDYRALYALSVNDPEKFWGQIVEEFYFTTGQPDGAAFLESNFDIRKGPIHISWMKGARTNICYNVLDRNVQQRGIGDQVAIYREGNDPDDFCSITYAELLVQVCRCANGFNSLGIKSGDRVVIYMPMILEIVVTMLACARIGAMHSVVFAGFSAESLAGRILDAKSTIVVTADGALRGDKIIPLKEITDSAIQLCKEQGHFVSHCIVVENLPSVNKTPSTGTTVSSTLSPSLKYVSFSGLVSTQPDHCDPEWVDSEHPLFLLYTSGSTGKPKGLVHTTAGYMIFAATTFKYVFDYKPGDVFWCTSDIGWLTGHTMTVYGCLAQGGTSVLMEGTPVWPSYTRMWSVVEKYKVNQIFTAPTLIRTLMKYRNGPALNYDLSSLKVLGSAGEPINPEAWLWYNQAFGGNQCSVVDNYWQTETGGPMITPLPGATPTKPGSATFPFFGAVPEILTENGDVVQGPGEGHLVFKQAWPGMARTIFGDHERFQETYFRKFPGYYCTGDLARRDTDGYIWITGRVDDMLNVSGHLLSTAQVESAIMEHKCVSEAAAVPVEHPVKGHALYCFVTLNDGLEMSKALASEIKDKVREKIGPVATPDTIHFAKALPKTRTGKIVRRLLRKIAAGDTNFGDISALADESVLNDLLPRPA